MSIWSNIGNAISSGFNAVCESVSKIGSSVAAFANDIKPTLGPLLNTIAMASPNPIIKTFAVSANALLHVLAIFKPNETVEEMGERALQAADKDITLDKFENFDEYMAELRNFELDPEVAEKHSKVEKMTAGLGIATAGVEEKFNLDKGSLNSIWMLPIANNTYFTPERINGLLENGKLNGDVSAYIEKRMGGEEARAFEKNFEFNTDGKPMNEGELGKLYEALDSSRTDWAKLQQQLKTGE